MSLYAEKVLKIKTINKKIIIVVYYYKKLNQQSKHLFIIKWLINRNTVLFIFNFSFNIY
jgi:hypothetical protein